MGSLTFHSCDRGQKINVVIFTARVRSTTEGYSFTLLVCSQGGAQVQLSGGGVRSSCWGRGGVRSSCGGGQDQLLGGGVRSSCRGGISSSCRGGVRSSQGGSVQPGVGGVSILHPLAGGMPLAFTQEDFLVSCVNSLNFSSLQFLSQLNFLKESILP